MDPAYLEVSQSTGGQLFLFQKDEASGAALAMSAAHSHPATILRAVGTLPGSREFEFPVDSTVSGLLVLASVQCRDAIRVYPPSGSELTAADSASIAGFQAGRILRIDRPEPGPWRVRISGSGLFVLSVQARAEIALSAVSVTGDAASTSLEARLSGEVSDLRVRLVDASGNPLAGPVSLDLAADGVYRAAIASAFPRFRVLVSGADSAARPFQRVYPVLFRASPAK